MANISSKKEKSKHKKIDSSIKKLTYSEKTELEKIEKNIPKLEIEISNLNALLNQKDVIENKDRLNEVCRELAILENEIEMLYIRWEELDKKA